MGQTPIFYASREGQEVMIKFLISKNANINQSDNKRHTPLFLAKKH